MKVSCRINYKTDKSSINTGFCPFFIYLCLISVLLFLLYLVLLQSKQF